MAGLMAGLLVRASGWVTLADWRSILGWLPLAECGSPAGPPFCRHRRPPLEGRRVGWIDG